MKAVIINKTGGPEVLQLQEVDNPGISNPTDVLVNLKAAGINPIDTKLRRGLYPMNHLPAILGCDGAGIVESVGPGVSRFKAGDEVFFFYGGLDNIAGNYAEKIVVDERFIIKKPEAMDFIHAAAAPLVSLTAWEALYDRAGIESGQTVLIHAGAGGVGHVAIQLARLAGARVCTTISSEEKEKFVRQLGAEHTINYRKADVVQEVMDWTEGKGVDIVMDNVGGAVTQQSFSAVKTYGDIVTLLLPDAKTDWTIARQRNLRFSFEVMLTPLIAGLVDAQRHQTWILEQCAALMQEGKLTVHVGAMLPLSEAAQAHALIEQGSTTGKIVLEIN